MAYANTLTALADPTRRSVFERLRSGPASVGELAAELPVSRPAVSQHLKALKMAGLVNDKPDGARRVYYIDPEGLGELRRWLVQFWDVALEAVFKKEVEKLQETPQEGRSRESNHQHCAPVRKTIVVQATPERAFAGIHFRRARSLVAEDLHNIGTAPLRESIIEPFVGGRWYSKCEDGSEVVVGHVSVWQPAQRFVVSWEISAQWKPDARVALASEVEVRFVADAAGGTRVELEHRNFERMGVADGETMRKGVDGGWPGLLELFAKEVSAGNDPGH